MIEEYLKIEPVIKRRVNEFRKTMEGSELDVFAELVFCLLTPQSKAKMCWEAVERLREKGLLVKGGPEEIESELKKGVRFHRTKARYICEARKLFMRNGKLRIKSVISRFSSPVKLRDYLVKNVKGMGYKEASHFLRNIGLGDEIAILDRHILRVMRDMGVIDDVPRSLSPRKYLEIEKKFLSLSQKLEIPPPALDLYFWYLKTGEVFK